MSLSDSYKQGIGWYRNQPAAARIVFNTAATDYLAGPVIGVGAALFTDRIVPNQLEAVTQFVGKHIVARFLPQAEHALNVVGGVPGKTLAAWRAENSVEQRADYISRRLMDFAVPTIAEAGLEFLVQNQLDKSSHIHYSSPWALRGVRFILHPVSYVGSMILLERGLPNQMESVKSGMKKIFQTVGVPEKDAEKASHFLTHFQTPGFIANAIVTGSLIYLHGRGK